MAGTSKCPFSAESHFVMVSLKALLCGKASKLIEVQLPRGPPLNLKALTLIGQKAQVVTETLQQHISTIWDLDKGLLMSRLDRVHNHNQLTQIVHWDMWQCKQKDAVSPELGSYSKALQHPKTTLPAETSYCWLLSSMLDYFYCFLSIIAPLSSILTSPTPFYSPSSLPVSAFKPWGSWQWRRQMQWPGELPQSSESCCVFCTDFLLLFFFYLFFLWSLPMIACFLQSCDELDCSFSPFSYQDPGERRSYSEG